MSTRTPIPPGAQPPRWQPPRQPPAQQRPLEWWQWMLIFAGAVALLGVIGTVLLFGSGGIPTRTTTSGTPTRTTTSGTASGTPTSETESTPQPTQPPATQPPATQPPATQPPATQPPPETATPVPAQPETVLQISGIGWKTSDTFTVSGTWKITYTVQPSNYDVFFGFFVYPKGESQAFYDSVSTNTPGTDSTIEHDGGTYYLKVISSTPWSITVTDLPG